MLKGSLCRGPVKNEDYSESLIYVMFVKLGLVNLNQVLLIKCTFTCF